MDDDQRRVGAAQVGVAQLDAVAVDQRRLVHLHGILEDAGQAAGGPAGHRRGEGGLHRLVQMPHPGAMQRGDEVDVGEVDEEQPALQLLLHVVAFGRFHAVPLVQRDDQRTAGFQHETEQIEVVLDHALAGIHDEHHHVGVLDGLQGLDHRELLDGLEDLAAPAHAGGVDQRVLFVVALERDVDAVARGAGLVVDHHALFTEHAVDQRGLADVGTADDGDLDAVLLARAGDARGFLAFGDVLLRRRFQRFDLVVLGEHAKHFFQHRLDAAPVGGGDRQRIAQAQRAELGARQVRVDGVDLVGDQETALVALAQVLGNQLVGGGQASARVDHEQHRIGFLDGQQRLLGHLGVDAFLVAGDPAGVDDDVGAALPLGFAVLAVAGQAGKLGDDGVAGTGQAVEQGRFAHVGTADQGNYGNHAALHFKKSKNTKAAARAAADHSERRREGARLSAI